MFKSRQPIREGGQVACVIAQFQDRENVKNPKYGRDFLKFIAGVKREFQFLCREFVERNFFRRELVNFSLCLMREL